MKQKRRIKDELCQYKQEFYLVLLEGVNDFLKEHKIKKTLEKQHFATHQYLQRTMDSKDLVRTFNMTLRIMHYICEKEPDLMVEFLNYSFVPCVLAIHPDIKIEIRMENP